jgi:hypothetical protein
VSFLAGSTQLKRALPSLAMAQLGCRLPAGAGLGEGTNLSACADAQMLIASRRREQCFMGFT